MSGNYYEVKPLSFGRNIECEVPGSKSITNRALLIAALAEGKSHLKGIQFSADTGDFIGCLKALGYQMELDEPNRSLVIRGEGKNIPKKKGTINIGSAGTAARFLTAMLAFSDGSYQFTSSEQMAKRPMEDLLVALEELGARFHYLEKPYHFPYRITGTRDKGKNVKLRLNIDKSSQYLSAILMSSVLWDGDLAISLSGKRKAKSYINITMKMMQDFGCSVLHKVQDGDSEKGSEDEYAIKKGARYKAREYEVEPDVSAACYFYAMAACMGGTAMVRGVYRDSIQGDVKFLNVLESMGCRIQDDGEGVRLSGPDRGRIKGIDVDLSDLSDQSMTLAAIAPFADAPVTIREIGHIRGQETDRIRAMGAELTRMGIRVEEGDTWLRIYPGKPKPVSIETYHDHRMAMAFTVTGLRVPGLRILNPDCCSKTFPNYFQVVEEIVTRRTRRS